MNYISLIILVCSFCVLISCVAMGILMIFKKEIRKPLYVILIIATIFIALRMILKLLGLF